jgi:hypothetical protein
MLGKTILAGGALLMAISLAQAAPRTFNNTGTLQDLEEFRKSCDYYIATLKRKERIRTLCRQYDRQLERTFQTGYRIDAMLPKKKHKHKYHGKVHECTEWNGQERPIDRRLLENYKQEIQDLEKAKEAIVKYVEHEKMMARKHYDVAYHEKLIRDRNIRIYYEDTVFIKEHADTYIDAHNPKAEALGLLKKSQPETPEGGLRVVEGEKKRSEPAQEDQGLLLH